MRCQPFIPHTVTASPLLSLLSPQHLSLSSSLILSPFISLRLFLLDPSISWLTMASTGSGRHCAMDGCRPLGCLDGPPSACPHCHRRFCTNHLSPSSHSCPHLPLDKADLIRFTLPDDFIVNGNLPVAGAPGLLYVHILKRRPNEQRAHLTPSRLRTSEGGAADEEEGEEVQGEGEEVEDLSVKVEEPAPVERPDDTQSSMRVDGITDGNSPLPSSFPAPSSHRPSIVRASRPFPSAPCPPFHHYSPFASSTSSYSASASGEPHDPFPSPSISDKSPAQSADLYSHLTRPPWPLPALASHFTPSASSSSPPSITPLTSSSPQPLSVFQTVPASPNPSTSSSMSPSSLLPTPSIQVLEPNARPFVHFQSFTGGVALVVGLSEIANRLPPHLKKVFNDRRHSIANSVGFVQVGNAVDGGHTGTCTLLTPHLLVTCLHVLRNLTDAATAQVTFYPAEELEGPTVPTTITLHPDVLFITSEEEDEKRRRVGEEELDFAIVAISIDLPPTSKVKPGVEPCLSKHNWQTDKPQKRVQVAGVHPERQAVEFYPPGDVKQMGLRTQGKWTYPLSYEANAEASYSGGAVLSQQMALLAIHQGGVVGQHNYGVPIQAILHCAQAVWEKQQRERGQDAGEVSGQAEADLVRLLMTQQMMMVGPSSSMMGKSEGALATPPPIPVRPVSGSRG